jgi:hypothetical protein
LTGGGLTNALTQLDGEAATGGERAVFQLTNEFLELMLDPFVNGRGNVGGGALGGPALGFAPDQQANLPPDIALAYASILTKARRKVSSSAGRRGARPTAVPTMPMAIRRPGPIMSGPALSVLPAAWIIT